MNQAALVKFHAAKHALAVCKNFDEVKDILDKAKAIEYYATIAKDHGLVTDATEIRLRAERRLGEMIGQQKTDGGLAKPGPKPNSVVGSDRSPPKLSEAGISKDLSSRAQNIAAVPEAEFEEELAGLKDRTKKDGKRVQTRLNDRGREVRGSPPKAANDMDLRAQLVEVQATARELLSENNAMAATLEADDKLAALHAENKQLRAQVRTLDARVVGFTNEVAAAKKAAQTWQRRAERAEKKLAA